MIRNYLITAWRNLSRNKLYSVINIGGLAIGMAVSFMLLLYVFNEFSFDRFNVNKDILYQVFRNQPNTEGIRTRPFTPSQLGKVLKQNYPEVTNFAHTNEPHDILINYKDKALKLSTVATDPSLLDMFTFSFISGDHRALLQPSSIVLTRSGARAIFGDENPMGRIVKYGNDFPLKVTAVIEDNPHNSTFSFKALVSWQSLLAKYPWADQAEWGYYIDYTYVQLKPGTYVANINSKIQNLLATYNNGDKNVKLFLYPFTRLHLYNEFKNGINTGGRIEYVRLFLFLAIGILLIACINFMNLSTARSGKRTREVGVRKAIGARRWVLVQQFISESVLMALFAFLLAILFMYLLFPMFNALIGIQLLLPYHKGWAWAIALTVTLLTGLLAGSYPAFFLSSFKAVNVLKGQVVDPQAAVRPRQVLVVVQFTFAICLILFSVFIYKQINDIKDRPVGYDRNGLIEMPIDGAMNNYNKFEQFRLEAINVGAITDAAKISNHITTNDAFVWNIEWPGRTAGEEKIFFDCMASTYHFINTYGLTVVAGRDFSIDHPADSTGVILNEASVKLMRLKSPIGQTVTYLGKKRTVVGVVKNFVSGSPYEAVRPAVIGFDKDFVQAMGLRLSANAPVSVSLAKLAQVYKKYNPADPFEYAFTDDNFRLKFNNEKLLGTMSAGFTCLAIIISSLGLFGLAAFSAEQRRKEIGIRKVLGAGIGILWFNLSREFIKLVLISFVIGAFISWYAIGLWLSKYTYHTGLSIWVFAVTMLVCLLICLVTVSWQAIKTAIANPVKSLRSE